MKPSRVSDQQQSAGPSSTRTRSAACCASASSPAPASTPSASSRYRRIIRSARLDNLVVTPHLGYVTEGCYRIFFHDIVEDIAAWLDGNPIRASVTPAAITSSP